MTPHDEVAFWEGYEAARNAYVRGQIPGEPVANESFALGWWVGIYHEEARQNGAAAALAGSFCFPHELTEDDDSREEWLAGYFDAVDVLTAAGKEHPGQERFGLVV